MENFMKKMTSDMRLELYDNFQSAYQEIVDINELLPYDMERQVSIDNLGKTEKLLYKFWRTGK
tara:strand:+ start:1361 stop:1549 length:189 start_codon:yes stop_codon:yes gene_type:complete